MKTPSLFRLLPLALISLGACEHPFTPAGPFLDRTVVFSLLVARADTQLVRVYRTYYPPNNNPLEVDGEIPDTTAQVVLSNGTGSINLKDALLKRGDGSSIHAYVAYPYRVEPGATYSLRVGSSERALVTSSTIVPGEGEVSVLNPEVLLDPASHITSDVYLAVTLNQLAAAYRVRLALEFQVFSSGAIVEVEVPFLLLTPEAEDKSPAYPSFQRTASIVLRKFTLTYSIHAYAYALRKIKADYGEVFFRRANCYLVQTDENLYKYYSIANGFGDAYSIRMDQPDYTNMKGGLGLFGSVNTDTASYILPSYIFIPPSL